MSKSDFLENKTLDHILGGPDYVRPATVYLGLFTSAPADGSAGTEVAGGAYARAAVTNDASHWPAAAGGVKSNGAAITFAQATAPWGTVVAFAVFDALVAGNMLFWGVLTVNKTVATGDTPSYPIGSLVFTED
jgi:hypothetical protein